VEVYFSVVRRKMLTPNDFDSLAAIEAIQYLPQNRIFAGKGNVSSVSRKQAAPA
jgi:hypothetical protein